MNWFLYLGGGVMWLAFWLVVFAKVAPISADKTQATFAAFLCVLWEMAALAVWVWLCWAIS